jgi:hypothetical protein
MVHSGEKVLSRDKKHIGFTTGAVRHCALEGCRGLRIVVKWQDGKITYPCSAGMDRKDNVWQIT